MHTTNEGIDTMMKELGEFLEWEREQEELTCSVMAQSTKAS